MKIGISTKQLAKYQCLSFSIEYPCKFTNASNKDGGGSDSEAEQEKLNDLESALKRYDPNFKNYSNSGASSNAGEGGSGGFVPTAEYYQLHIGTERIRAPELFFQPSFIGYALRETKRKKQIYKIFPS